jgi:Ser/Thr protein kinase RdoA (MazF antagonist)
MSEYVWGDQETQYFYEIGPEDILKAVDCLGLRSTGRILQLNSLENRVYQVEIELEEESTNPSDHFVIIKFYRPGRWTKNQILDEHTFLFDLREQEIPVIAPLKINGTSLFELKSIYYALFPKKGGRIPDEFDEEASLNLGRLLGRVHLVGAKAVSQYRIKMNPDTFGKQNIQFLLDKKLIHPQIETSYLKTWEGIEKLISPLFQNLTIQRIHGDCHRGNILYAKDGFSLVDFDDMVMGPKVQDLWLIFPGRDEETLKLRDEFLIGYDEFNNFDYSSLKLIEPLRTLRFIHFSAWIGKRIDDPSFQRAFPYYGTIEYWNGQLKDLQDQLELISASI